MEEHLRLFNKPVMEIITGHEAWPGSFFMPASQFPGKARKLISCGSNTEGSAHYAEQMMVEGFGNGDPKVKPGAAFRSGCEMSVIFRVLSDFHRDFIRQGSNSDSPYCEGLIQVL